jgi:hypothetical protein
MYNKFPFKTGQEHVNIAKIFEFTPNRNIRREPTLLNNNTEIYSILVNNRLYTPPNEGINWPLWHRSVKNLPSKGWFNYSNNGIKHYFIQENHTLYLYTV